ncbi:low temperature requirement protein A [Caulobacter sp. 17J65-9]|uniref:low temperature requirement protein A n=1 Tax=Caulobacter sp. 17J65-9 TaxID=2709382 RepID=UPI0013C772B3|nr:low temperature requirement protein A [Caulobacter sp. 17J65-9]NEX91965.1 low temperature requirement protein A [Caulobacter sp. 17J65-9]
MTIFAAPSGLLRERRGHDHARVTFVELFFDLVFVFAVTQLSHTLLHDLSLGGVLEVGLLAMAVWWVWVYTSWLTNWLDPERSPVRLGLFVLMLAGLVLSTSLPRAFGDRGLAFAAAYVFMQVGRTGFMLWALGPHRPTLTRSFQRIGAWFVASGAAWLAGAFVEGEARLAFWALAVLIEYLGPSAGYWSPGLGRSSTGDWNIEGGHLAERCGLFVIIALGESVLVTGATFAELVWTFDTAAAFVVAFAGSVAMWWLYFDGVYEAASQRIAGSADPGRIGRSAYTYVHLPIVAGIIVAAVEDELTLHEPLGALEPAMVAAVLGGPALYLLGLLLFKRTVFGYWSPSRLGGLAMLAALVPLAGVLTPLWLSTGAAAVLVIVAAWERRLQRRQARA